MNIAIFASAFYPNVGGVEEVCRQLAHEYRRRGGHNVTVFTERWPRSLPEHEIFEGISIHRIPFRVPSEGWKVKVKYLFTHRVIRRRVLTLLKRFQPTVVHVHCVSNNAFYAMEACQALGVPLIVTLHGELTMDAQQIFQRSKLARDILRRTLQRADAITACSHQTLSEAEAFYGLPLGDRSRVVYNGIDVAEVARAVPCVHPRPYIFAIGRHVAQKGFDVLLHAMRSLAQRGQHHDLILAGDGSEHEALRTLAAELGLEGSIVFSGRVDHSTAMSLFLGCEMFVLPSRHEPFGIVNLEAMAVGKPIVATRVGGVPEIVTDGENGLLVPPEDPVALADAIEKLSDDAALRQRLGSAGRERAANFTWQKIANDYLKIYEMVRSESTGWETARD